LRGTLLKSGRKNHDKTEKLFWGISFPSNENIWGIESPNDEFIIFENGGDNWMGSRNWAQFA
jgi:hypothetical protein